MICNGCGDVVGDPLFQGCSCDDEMDAEEAQLEKERLACVWCDGTGKIRATGIICRTCGGTGIGPGF